MIQRLNTYLRDSSALGSIRFHVLLFIHTPLNVTISLEDIFLQGI